jgi:hypothetical protein
MSKEPRHEPSPYQRAERRRQAAWKQVPGNVSAAARAPGQWKHVPDVGHVLPVEHADENLWSQIREDALAAFLARDIVWHDGDSPDYGPRASDSSGPSPNLCDSQVACMNFFWPLQRVEGALELALREIVPELARVVAAADGLRLIEPEWVGLESHLGERGWPQRGRYATSADLMIAYEDRAERRHGLLVECKYSESYTRADWRVYGERRADGTRTDRSATYRPVLARHPLFREDAGLEVNDLLIEPFDQHLRQQLLAAAIEASGADSSSREVRFETVTLLHVAPRSNDDFHATVLTPKIQGRGTVAETWRSVLRRPDRYRSVAYEDLFNALAGVPDLEQWRHYQIGRYPWAASPSR